MDKIFEVVDKSKRKIYLTRERYKHILKHPKMHNILEIIPETLENPFKMVNYALEEDQFFIINIIEIENLLQSI